MCSCQRYQLAGVANLIAIRWLWEVWEGDAKGATVAQHTHSCALGLAHRPEIGRSAPVPAWHKGMRSFGKILGPPWGVEST